MRHVALHRSVPPAIGAASRRAATRSRPDDSVARVLRTVLALATLHLAPAAALARDEDADRRGTPASAAAEGSGEYGNVATDDRATEDRTTDDRALDGSGELPAYSSTTTTRRNELPGRSSSEVDRDDLRVRLPRSAPDALRYEPGVFIQQTSQAQGSAFIRGRTGQQTVLLFDSVRLNNSLFRQGPNQYFFTIDSQTIDTIEVLRGSASVRYGSDALAGVIHARPIEPTIDAERAGVWLQPRAFGRYQTADDGWGARAQFDVQIGPHTGVLAGVGYRSMGLLESGGAVRNPADGEIPEVPRFADDGRTQLGTGFDEFTADVRVVHELSDELRLIAASYVYQQYDAPRTDQCPAAFAPYNECLRYDEQYRTLVYAALDGDVGPAARGLRLTLSWQRQHERRLQERPSSFTINGGRDDVDSLGLSLLARTRWWELGPRADLRLRWGGDAYHDRVDSAAWLEFTDVDIVRLRSRGQYLDGSSYTTGGLFSEAEIDVLERIDLRAGARLAAAGANAPADDESGTLAVDQTWVSGVGNAGITVAATRDLDVSLNLDQGFRAPNLDDLTSRQQTGPGFQIENAALQPERALTAEIGVAVEHPVVSLSAWAYHSSVRDAIARSLRSADECPQNTPQCGSSWSRFQLINLDGVAVIYGAEGAVEVRMPVDLEFSATVAWAKGTGANPEDRTEFTADGYRDRVPLSRIPPLNGTAELRWAPSYRGHFPWLGAAMRWATTQDRLATTDRSDARIPIGGTPGFAVVDAQAGYRFGEIASVALVVENLGDAAYRYHGSSVNGAGRGLLLQLELGAPALRVTRNAR
jgi:outer membrane receptor protein involved in Fe transport